MFTQHRQNLPTARLQLICCALLILMIAGCGGRTITATSLIRINIGDGDKSAFETYKQTQATLIKSTFVLRTALRPPEISQLSTLAQHPKPVEWLEKHIKTKFPSDSEILKVSFQCKDAEDAKAIVDAVVDAYIEEVAQTERNYRAQRLDMLRASYRKQTGELKDALANVNKLAAANGSGGSSVADANKEVALEKIKSLNNQLATLNSDLVKSRTDVFVQQARQQAALSLTPTPDSDLELPEAKARLKVLNEAVETRNKEYVAAHEAILDLSVFSADLEVKKLEVSILSDRVRALSNQIYELEMEVREQPRIQVVQKADTKKDDDLF